MKHSKTAAKPRAIKSPTLSQVAKHSLEISAPSITSNLRVEEIVLREQAKPRWFKLTFRYKRGTNRLKDRSGHALR